MPTYLPHWFTQHTHPSHPTHPNMVLRRITHAPHPNSNCKTTQTRKPYGCILWIAVHPKHRQKGIALNLTTMGTAWLMDRSATAVFASTQRRNQAALATLSKAGFARCRFGGLWKLFGWRVFEFFKDIWLAPSEVILMKPG